MTQLCIDQPKIDGASALYRNATRTRIAVSASARRRLVNLDLAGSFCGESADLGAAPYAFTTIDELTYYAVLGNGRVAKVSSNDGMAVAATLDVLAADTGWIAQQTGIITAPGRLGEVVTIDAATLTLRSVFTDMLDRVQLALRNGNYYYAFDGRGTCAVFIVGTLGQITKISEVRLEGAVDVVGGTSDAGALTIACTSRSRVLTISLADPVVPVVSSSVFYPGKTLLGLISGDPLHRPVCEQIYDDLGLSLWYAPSCGLLSGGTLYLGHGQHGRFSIVS